jgi:hypothetical protein
MTCESQRNMKTLQNKLVPRMCSAPRGSSVLAGYCPMADEYLRQDNPNRRSRPGTDEPSAHPWHQIFNSSCTKGRHFQVKVGSSVLYSTERKSQIAKTHIQLSRNALQALRQSRNFSVGRMSSQAHRPDGCLESRSVRLERHGYRGKA